MVFFKWNCDLTKRLERPCFIFSLISHSCYSNTNWSCQIRALYFFCNLKHILFLANPVYRCTKFLWPLLWFCLLMSMPSVCIILLLAYPEVMLSSFTVWVVTFPCVIINYLGSYNLHETETVVCYQYYPVLFHPFCWKFLQILCSFAKAIKSGEYCSVYWDSSYCCIMISWMFLFCSATRALETRRVK